MYTYTQNIIYSKTKTRQNRTILTRFSENRGRNGAFFSRISDISSNYVWNTILTCVLWLLFLCSSGCSSSAPSLLLDGPSSAGCSPDWPAAACDVCWGRGQQGLLLLRSPALTDLHFSTGHYTRTEDGGPYRAGVSSIPPGCSSTLRFGIYVSSIVHTLGIYLLYTVCSFIYYSFTVH